MGAVVKDRARKAAKLFAQTIKEGKPLKKGQILLQAGYAPSIAEQPSRITQSDKFRMLLDKYLPDEYLVGKHADLLENGKSEGTKASLIKLGYNLRGHTTAQTATQHLHAHKVSWIQGVEKKATPELPAQSVQSLPTDDKTA